VILLPHDFLAPAVGAVAASCADLAKNLDYDAGWIDSKESIRPAEPVYLSGMAAVDLVRATAQAAERSRAPHGVLVLSFDSVVSRNSACEVLEDCLDFIWAGIPPAFVPFRATQHLRAVPGTSDYATDVHLRSVHRLLILERIFHPWVAGHFNNFGKDLLEDWINYRHGWPSPRDEERSRFFQARSYPRDCSVEREFKALVSDRLVSAWREGRLHSDAYVEATIQSVSGVVCFRRQESAIQVDLEKSGLRVRLLGPVFEPGFSATRVEQAMARLQRIPEEEIEETFFRIRAARAERNRARLNLDRSGFHLPKTKHHTHDAAARPAFGTIDPLRSLDPVGVTDPVRTTDPVASIPSAGDSRPAGDAELRAQDIGEAFERRGEELVGLAEQVDEGDSADRFGSPAGTEALGAHAGERAQERRAGAPSCPTESAGGGGAGSLRETGASLGGALDELEQPMDRMGSERGVLAAKDRAGGLFARRDQALARIGGELQAFLDALARTPAAAASQAHGAARQAPGTGKQAAASESAAGYLLDDMEEALVRRAAVLLGRTPLAPEVIKKMAADARFWAGEGLDFKEEWLKQLSPIKRARLEKNVARWTKQVAAVGKQKEKSKDNDLT
jgi:hypothetical protein